MSLCSLRYVVLVLAFPFLLAYFAVSAFAQDGPIFTINEDCQIFAFAPDGRIVYSVRRIVRVREIEMQRDDIWVASRDGKSKRIVNGEKLFPGNAPVGYGVQAMRWSPDGTRLTVEMMVRQMVDQDGTIKEALLTMLFDDNGKEIKVEGGGNVLPEASQAAWLGDGVTIAYLTEAVKPRLLFAVNTLRAVAGRGGRLFDRHAFAGVAWDAKRQMAAAVERDATLSGPPRLVWLDLQKQTRRELVELPGYLGSLTLSPLGTKIAYFADAETLEVRSIEKPDQATRVKVALGPYQWDPSESRILIKRGFGRRSSDLMWIGIPDGKIEPVLHSLTYWDFALSPDGTQLAVTSPGKHKLEVFSLR